jgi:hypothetical protein
VIVLGTAPATPVELELALAVPPAFAAVTTTATVAPAFAGLS